MREAKDAAKKMMGTLLEGEYASSGAVEAAVVLVEFSDFQCPYCNKMRTLLAAEPLLKSGNQVRLVFRHMPLAQHDWAKQAAEAAACAEFQSRAAFWQFHNALFDSQATMTHENVEIRLKELASKTPGLSTREFETCLSQQRSLGVVIRDQEIGARVGAKGTPTLFINGQELQSIGDAEELHRALQQAVDQAKAEHGTHAVND